MTTDDDQRIEWLASQIMPHEREARARLRRAGSRAEEIDDVIQDAYLQLTMLPRTDHIRDGRAYLMTTVRSVVLQRVRRARVVRIDQLLDSDTLALADDAPGPEQRLQARDELQRVYRIIAELPPRCRQIVEWRRIDGLSLAEIAARLGVTEKVVEHETYRGLRILLERIGEGEGPAQNRPRSGPWKRIRAKTGRRG